MAEAARATLDLRGLLDASRDRASLRVYREPRALVHSTEVHRPSAEDEIVPYHVLRIARTVRDFHVPADALEHSTGHDQAADNGPRAGRARRDNCAPDRLPASRPPRRGRHRGREWQTGA